jgi:hypothetical protein
MEVSFEVIEKLCADAKTREDWESLIETYDARDLGSFVADWADHSAYHPHESAGIVAIEESDFAVVASWTDDGFWDISIEDVEDAKMMVDNYSDEYYSDDDVVLGADEDWLPEDGWDEENEQG